MDTRGEEEDDEILEDDDDDEDENDFNEILEETHCRCKCAVENSSRFSLRVMEAMRLLQRQEDQPSTSSAEDIVDYIRTNYRSDGDLYAQVRTALKQICSQGFAVELLNNEYHLIGPVTNWSQDACDCETHKSPEFPKRNGPPHHASRLERTLSIESPGDFVTDVPHEETLLEHNQQRDVNRIREIEQRDIQKEPVAGPLKRLPPPIPATNAKRTRLENHRAQGMDERDEEETTTEEDLDCICDDEMEYITREEHLRNRRGDRSRVIIKDNENEHTRENADLNANENDDDTDDNARKRSRARERELERWIRRCRRECERRRTR